MALTEYSYSAGPLLAGKPVSVCETYTGNSIAYANVSIFSDAGGVYQITNPTFLDANGNISFYAAAGTYGILVEPRN